jgi:hypothetical protein
MAREAQTPDPATPADKPVTTIDKTIGVALDAPGYEAIRRQHDITCCCAEGRSVTSVPPVFA